MGWSRYAIGLILAAMTKRRNFDEICEIYTEYVLSLDNGFHIEKFMNLKNDLMQKISLNTIG